MALCFPIVPGMQRDLDFSTVGAAAKPGGAGQVPSSNTGPKYPHLAAPIIDACAVSIPSGALKRAGLHRYDELVWWIFGFQGNVAIGPLLERAWLFCNHSATMVDQDGEVVGKLGLRDDGNVLVSLMGKGCAYVRNWHTVESRLDQVNAHLTRVDIAVDDLQGHAFDVERFRCMYHAGEFNTGGRNPDAVFHSDEGSRKGSSLTIGKKGNKQLQIYEKGRQLGDPDSKHGRCELRLWRNKVDLPLDALTNPGKYYGAAYKLLAEFVVGEVEKLEVRERNVNATAKAMVACLKNQSGTALGLVLDALGEDAFDFIVKNIKREGRPARFKSIPGDLRHLVRTQLTKENSHEDQDHQH
jgi:phage replication initiation protein